MANKQVIINSNCNLKYKSTSLMFCIVQEYLSQINKRLRPLNISLTQLQILDMLEMAPLNSMSVNDIKSNLADDCPNVSRSLNKLLETRNVVKKRCHVDQRVVYVSITNKGRDTHKLADGLIEDIHVNLEGNDLEQFYQLLLKL
jgi:MarR family transcriptional regulator, organic hydroperoxide resistance regulator